MNSPRYCVVITVVHRAFQGFAKQGIRPVGFVLWGMCQSRNERIIMVKLTTRSDVTIPGRYHSKIRSSLSMIIEGEESNRLCGILLFFLDLSLQADQGILTGCIIQSIGRPKIKFYIPGCSKAMETTRITKFHSSGDIESAQARVDSSSFCSSIERPIDFLQNSGVRSWFPGVQITCLICFRSRSEFLGLALCWVLYWRVASSKVLRRPAHR